MISPLGARTEIKYDALDRRREITGPNGAVTKFSYDKAGRLTKLEQYRLIDDTFAGMKVPEYQITTYERDKKGKVILVKSPLGKAVKFGYDKVGNMTSKLDEDGLETLYEYNLAGKLAKVSYADGKTVELGYNALGQLTAMHDWLGTTRIEVDALGRATKVTDFESKEVGYVWNALGQKEKLIYPDGSEVKYEYNPSGRLNRALSEAGTANYTYDPMGRLMERILPDSTATRYEMNPLGRLTSLTHSRDGDILDQFKYSYDPAGNITQIEKHRAGMESDSGIFEYTYDPLGRLVAAARGEDVKRYRYDELGNRVKEWRGHKYDAEEWTRHSYNARNQLIKTQEGDAVKEYGYDGRGNLTNITENGQLKSRFDFDATNMMVSAFAAGKGSAEYAYNGFRNRVKKLESLQNAGAASGAPQDPTREVRYTLDLTLPYNNLLMTEGSQNQRFVWGNSLLSASGDDDFYYLQDHLGSPIRLLGEDQNDTPLAYDEFGVPLVESGQNPNNPFGFTGYQADEVSGLYYAQARYYEPQLGRFGAQDTHWNPGNMIFGDALVQFPNNRRMPNAVAVLQSTNLYNYCINNPLIYVDKDGDKVTVEQDGNNITINAEFNIQDNTTTNIVTGFWFWRKETTYEEAFLNGIIERWSGTVGDYQITTIATKSPDGVSVRLNNGYGVSNVSIYGEWSDSNRGVITMYQGDSRNQWVYSKNDFVYVAAHEFGHIMGIADAYGYQNSKKLKSIMNAFGTKLQPRDIEMLLQAWNIGKWQTWPDMGNRTPLSPLFAQISQCLD